MLFDLSMFKTRLFTGAIVSTISMSTGIISSISQSHGIIELDEKKEYIKKGTLLKFYRYEDLLN